jgi:hypothetical protein
MDELLLLLKSRHPLLLVESQDEERVLQRVAAASAELGFPFFRWTVTDGLRRHGSANPIYETAEPAQALGHIAAAGGPSVYALCDFAPFATDPRNARRLRDVAQAASAQQVTLVLVGPAIEVPAELRHLCARWTLELPAADELRQLVLDACRELEHGDGKVPRFALGREELDQFVRHLSGLTAPEARRVVGRCVLDDGALDVKDLAVALEAKKDRVADSGILQFVDARRDAPALGGLANLKGWLGRAKAGYSERARELGLSPPRGLLLVGVQGCGKSLAAKSVAREWSLPLLRLDPGRLLDKYVGESEKNLRRAFELAETVAPCVLWIDEIEKAFAGGTAGAGSEADAGLSRRIFGSFLTWLQEKKADVFVVATANDLSALPPELLRKGRFDEIFFIDLPNAVERDEIFRTHLLRRKQDPFTFDLPVLVAASAGFSGAEIEQAIVTALYGLIAAGGATLTTVELTAELARTVPLSRTRREDIEALRELAADRFVPAS